MDLPFFRRVSKKCQRSRRFLKSRPLNGSSRIRILGSCRMERIMLSLTFCPPESWLGSLFMSSLSFNISRSSVALFMDWSWGMPELRPKILMLSRMDRSGIRLMSWGVKPSLFLLKILSLPKMRIFPECFLVTMPAIIFKKVDLPQPDLPMIATISPGFRDIVMSRRTSWFG